MTPPEQPEATVSGAIEYAQLIEMPANAAHPAQNASLEPQPLIDRLRNSPEPAARITIPPAFRPRAAAGPRSAAPIAERPHEPDEIRIHIGRIDVTAVPPPVTVRPAARPERKSVNLDQYLKERRGGNR